MMRKELNLALIQPYSTPGQVIKNLVEAEKLCRKAAAEGANFLCLPELFNTGYHLQALGEDILTLGIEFYSYTAEKMSALARELGCYLLCPLVEPCTTRGEAKNSAIVFDDHGHEVFRYAKAYLWALEKNYFREGEQLQTFDSPFGRIGVLICYDLGFPEAARELCLQGAELILAPAAWRVQDEDMWHSNLQQRALENICFVAGNNASMDYQGLNLFGRSKVCNPRGEVISEAGSEEGYQVVSIDFDQVAKTRMQIPYLKDRKPHLYQSLGR